MCSGLQEGQRSCPDHVHTWPWPSLARGPASADQTGRRGPRWPGALPSSLTQPLDCSRDMGHTRDPRPQPPVPPEAWPEALIPGTCGSHLHAPGGSLRAGVISLPDSIDIGPSPGGTKAYVVRGQHSCCPTLSLPGLEEGSWGLGEPLKTAGPRGLRSSAPPPSVPASVWLGGEQEQAVCCSPTGHQAVLLAAWTRPVVLETLGGALGRPEPTHVGMRPPLTTWLLSRVAQFLVFSRRCFRCTGVSRPRCDEAVPSVRQNP